MELAGNLGYSLSLNGETRDAFESLLKALALNPKRTANWAPLIKTYHDLGLKKEALGAALLSFKYSSSSEKTIAYMKNRAMNEHTPSLSEIYQSAYRIINSQKGEASSAMEPLRDGESNPALRQNISKGEVGDGVVALNPNAKPVFTKKNARYWACDGMVNERLLSFGYAFLRQLSEKKDIFAPNESLCLYSISKMNIFGTTVTFYTINYYVSSASMETCLKNDYCSDLRSVTLLPKRKVKRKFC